MKIVNRDTFMHLAKGTIYSYYTPSIFEGLYIKTSEPDELYHDSTKKTLNDFVCVPLIDGFVKGSYDNNVNHEEMDHFEFDLDCSTRDGMYEEDQLFAIYDENDILQLVSKLTEAF